MFEILVLVCVLTVLFYLWKGRRPHNYPPGPTPLPFVGNIFQIPQGHMYQVLEKWSKKYGHIIGVSIVDQLVVFVSGADNVIAALRKEEFQGRPVNFQVRDLAFGQNLGLFNGNGSQWMSSRKFTVKQMRAFGKNQRENVIVDEISRLMETFKDGSTINGTGIFGVSAVNVIWTIIANKRIDLNDVKSRKFLNNLFSLFRQGNPNNSDWYFIFPSLRFLSSKYRFFMDVLRETQEYMRSTIQEHREILDVNNPLDLIDGYLVEMESRKASEGSYFTEEDLITVGVDLFAAGAESVSNSIEFVLLYMVLYPEVQKKMQEELDRVLGRSRRPVLEDKNELDYTMAILSEVERSNTIAPATPPHSCTKDTTFGGYFIPQRTVIALDLWSLGHDPKYWKNPDEFNPERFIDAKGKYSKSSILHAFGMGQRACVGEVFARNIIFLFTTTFLEKFSVSLPPGDPKPSTLALPGFTTAPRPFRITIKSRY